PPRPLRAGRRSRTRRGVAGGIASRRHGALLFSKDGAQYIDYNSANGSSVDGARVPANVPVDVRNSSLITIAPFQIATHVDLVETQRLVHDPDASTPGVALLRPRAPAPDDHAWKNFFQPGEALPPAAARRGAIERAERARP